MIRPKILYIKNFGDSMTIFDKTFIPYEFKTKEECYRFLTERALFIKKSLKLIEADAEHLCIKCPMGKDYLDITGATSELAWLNSKLSLNNWYSIK